MKKLYNFILERLNTSLITGEWYEEIDFTKNRDFFFNKLAEEGITKQVKKYENLFDDDITDVCFNDIFVDYTYFSLPLYVYTEKNNVETQIVLHGIISKDGSIEMSVKRWHGLKDSRRIDNHYTIKTSDMIDFLNFHKKRIVFQTKKEIKEDLKAMFAFSNPAFDKPNTDTTKIIEEVIKKIDKYKKRIKK